MLYTNTSVNGVLILAACREMRLHNISTTLVELWNGRDLIEFRSTEEGMYTNNEDVYLLRTEDGNKT